MSFGLGGKEVKLRGLSTPNNKWVAETPITREAKKKGTCILLQIRAQPMGAQLNTHAIPPNMLKIIKEYNDILKEPKGLPPSRQQDHGIMLQHGAEPKWRPYLLGRQFTVRTDHQSLKYLWEQCIATTAQQKWLVKLMGYDFVIEYKKGNENSVADALSRRFEEASITAISYPVPHWLDPIKEEVGQQIQVQTALPNVREEDGVVVPLPQTVLERRIKKRKAELLIHWQGLTPAEATWEVEEDMKNRYPDLALEVKSSLRGGELLCA
ncbi:hypothetical protein MRB53_024415 [Persea americana]|uniref:Uncharacterized protein n=1 Tax=Persea americana TaxID=3435 RepID=A0ACC2LC54_PERAE|nr:hypothetical protein MRB53_024415 [Persea americana]